MSKTAYLLIILLPIGLTAGCSGDKPAPGKDWNEQPPQPRTLISNEPVETPPVLSTLKEWLPEKTEHVPIVLSPAEEDTEPGKTD